LAWLIRVCHFACRSASHPAGLLPYCPPCSVWSFSAWLIRVCHFACRRKLLQGVINYGNMSTDKIISFYFKRFAFFCIWIGIIGENQCFIVTEV
jgi:hypothetical protein